MSDGAVECPCCPALLDTVRELASRHPDTPFLTLGQTVFWDEPLKAIVRQALDRAAPSTRMVLAVHDTDYFARPHATLARTDPYVILPHNDGSTRDLWCAAGEISRLFGAETVPTRAAMHAAGVRFDVAARARSETVHELLDRMTEAWGWRGIAHTSGIETLTHEVSLQEVLPCLLEQLDWAFAGTAESMCHCIGGDQAEAVAARLRARVVDISTEHHDGTLSDLYQSLFPEMHALLLGETASSTETSHSLRESRFGADTAGAARFRIVDLFLQPQTRDVCISAYNNAVRGSEIYTLDKFGEGAIPFDLITPAGGRGTIRVVDDGVHIDGRVLSLIPTQRRVESVQHLAEVVNEHFGETVSLVGKAVTWISILASDFIFVFNEGASSYTRRTRQMLEEIRAADITLRMNPILRVRYHTWDALADVPTGFCLPDHYAEAFGKREISAKELSESWRTGMAGQEELLLELGKLSRPVDLLRFLEQRFGEKWTELLACYLESRAMIRAANASEPARQREKQALRDEHFHCGVEIDRLQKQRGVLRQGTMEGASDPTARDTDRLAIQSSIDSLRQRRQKIRENLAALQESGVFTRAAGGCRAALATVRSIEAQAELERLRLARGAYLVVHSLEHNDRRASAWWLPMVSPDGAWFRSIARSATAYIEPL